MPLYQAKHHKRYTTLKQVLPADRPRCGNCNKPLRPETTYLVLGAHPEPPPEGTPLVPESGGKPIGWAKLLSVLVSSENVPRTEGGGYGDALRITGYDFVTVFYAHVWTGHYQGVSRGLTAGHPFFCSMNCAAAFGCRCYKAGLRPEGAPTC